MGVESEAKETVQLFAEKVFPFQNLCHEIVEKKPNVPIVKFHQYQCTTKQDKIWSRLGAHRMPFFRPTQRGINFFLQQKMPYFNFCDNLRHNGTLLHNCNKNATLNKKRIDMNMELITTFNPSGLDYGHEGKVN